MTNQEIELTSPNCQPYSVGDRGIHLFDEVSGQVDMSWVRMNDGGELYLTPGEYKFVKQS